MLSSILIQLVRKELTQHLNLNSFYFYLFSILEPVSLIGEGEYNLNALKEIEAKDSFLGLDQDVRKCQNDETLFNCTTRKYIEAVVSKCKCLPSNLRLFNKVWQIDIQVQLFASNIPKKCVQEPHCSAEKLACVNTIPVDTSSCIKPCSGLIVTSFDKSMELKDLKIFYPKILKNYNNFKTISSYPSGLIGITIYYAWNNFSLSK